MPVYIRKLVSYTPPSIARMSDEEDDDYLLDPDQLVDVLPQPYRMINKVLIKILDDAWEIIEQKNNKRLAEERKLRPPKYDKPNKLPIITAATALAGSEDGKYLFAGLPNGLAAVDTSNHQIVSQWEEERVEINSIQTFNFSPNAILLVTMDDMAVARLFFFAFDCLLFVKVLNEVEGHSSKLLACRCEASAEGDYVGVVFENPSNKEVWFEAYKTPRESWLSDLEAMEAKIQKQKEKDKEEEKGEQSDVAKVDSTIELHTASQAESKEQEKTGDLSRVPSPASAAIVHSHSHKFTPPSLVLKVKPPVPYTPCAASSVFSAVQKVDATGHIVGVGHAHIMSSAHLESRDSTFKQAHSSLIKYMANEEDRVKAREQEVMMATFHFCNPGRTLLTGLEPVGQMGHPCCVAMWWKGSNHVLQFSLLKSTTPGKAPDVEPKPDVVWPFSSNITCSTVSPCTSHMAVGLDNGNVVVWDRYIGIQRGVTNMSHKPSAVQTLRFLDPSLYPAACMDYPPYLQRQGCYLVTQYKDCTQYLYDVGKNVQDQPMCTAELPESDDEVQTLLQSVPALPELSLMVQKNGTLYLKDVLTGVRVCQLALPPSHNIHTPWEPILAFGGRGQLLYVKGSGGEEGEAEETTDTSGVFVFPLRSFRTLDHYWSNAKECNPVKLLLHPTVDDRLDALMKERIAQQALRKNRLQLRWGMLRSDLAIIQNAREVTHTATRPFMP